MILNSIGQEIRLSGGSCRDFGREMGEKVAEEAAMRGVITGQESPREFTWVFFSKVFPLFFSGCPEISDNTESQKITVDLSTLEGLSIACRPGILTEFVIGLLYGASIRVLGAPIVLLRIGKGLKLIVSYRNPSHLYDKVEYSSNLYDGTGSKIIHQKQIKGAPREQ